MSFFVLFESAAGYALFSVLESEEIGSLADEVQAGMTDLSRFQRIVKMIGFSPFLTAEEALENINAISEHELSDALRVCLSKSSFSFLNVFLQAFLEANVPKGKKSKSCPLGVVRSKFLIIFSNFFRLNLHWHKPFKRT